LTFKLQRWNLRKKSNQWLVSRHLIDLGTLARIPFEIYQDQHAALKQFSLDEQNRGEKGSMSQMVREALDAYISKRRKMRE
jgi:hypothetical protein